MECSRRDTRRGFVRLLRMAFCVPHTRRGLRSARLQLLRLCFHEVVARHTYINIVHQYKAIEVYTISVWRLCAALCGLRSARALFNLILCAEQSKTAFLGVLRIEKCVY